jgi:dihydrodipicolinate synthase/N-acetylneuraminate lyase
MTQQQQISGIVPIIPTPFTNDEEIDEPALRNLIEFAISRKLQTVCLPAYASEFYKLSDEEKCRVVQIAIDQSAGRIQIMAQSNSAALKLAIRLAEQNIAAGADIISLAVPRLFNLPEAAIEEYLSAFFDAIPQTPVLIQDFNPGGASISVSLINELSKRHQNFKYLKLEEPLCAPKFEAIINATEGRIGVFEGWGGLYLMELVPIGIRGVMPGLGVADIFLLTKHGTLSLCRKRIIDRPGCTEKQPLPKSPLHARCLQHQLY